MTKHPEKILTLNDIPVREPGAARYVPSFNATGSWDVVMYPSAGQSSVIDSKPNFQSAVRSCMRWQKRENTSVAAENKRREKNVAA